VRHLPEIVAFFLAVRIVLSVAWIRFGARDSQTS